LLCARRPRPADRGPATRMTWRPTASEPPPNPR